MLLLSSSTGCYYGHLASGQLRVLMARTSTEGVKNDPATPERIREQLELVEAARAFASELGLDAGERYTSYVEWPGDRLITTVVATRPGEIEATPFEFPIIGKAPYKGFFSLERAEELADDLRAEGNDVCLVPVSAYSTLGWFDDPITTPMLRRKDAALVETIVHELVHATVFVESQPEFNEGIARFIGQEGSVRFYAREGSEAAARARRRVEENRLVDREMMELRNAIASLYAVEDDPGQRDAAREALERATRARLAALPLTQYTAAEMAERVPLGDACLALRGTYNADIPRYAAVLDALDGDLPAFLARLEEAAKAPDPRAAFFAGFEATP